MLVKSRSADEDDAFRSIHFRLGFEKERRVTRVERGGGPVLSERSSWSGPMRIQNCYWKGLTPYVYFSTEKP